MTKTHSLGICGVIVLAAGVVTLAAPAQRYAPAVDRMTGTYQLDSSRGDNPQRAAEQATRSLPPDRRDRVYESLINRLSPPAQLALDRKGRTVTIVSSTGPRATFDADGRMRNEQLPNGREITTRAELVGDRLSVSTSGNRGSDFSVTFEALDNGDRLSVTRRLDNEEMDRPVTIQSFYSRVSDQPRWDLYAEAPRPTSTYGSGYGAPPPYAPTTGGFAVPEGTRLVATLDTPLSTRSARSGERFTMTVRGPAQFEGARIDGVVSRVNPYQQGSNRADMMVNFETIHFRGGQAAELRAVLDTVRTPDGNTVRVDAEGGVRDKDVTDTRVEHGAVGAALGAIIGAIAGGGKGAAIGAIAGGAGGAILVEGRDSLDLPPGTEVTLTAVSPRYR
jgi:hypothetical protein